MNDAELDKKLKAARGPALDADYLEDFSRQVLGDLRRTQPRSEPTQTAWWPGLAWGAVTAVCVAMAFGIGLWHGRKQAEGDVLASTKVIQETLAMFPNQVRAIVHDERGVNVVLSDKPDVPVSTPIYVRICNGQSCASVVTFSGQDVKIAGQNVTVLANASGGVILEGNQFAWSSTDQGPAPGHLKIEARLL